MQDQPDQCFNGAAIFRPRKQSRREMYPQSIKASMGPRSSDRGNLDTILAMMRSSVASMGPRSFDRGNCQFTANTAADGSGFNGAAIFRPRKRVRFHASRPRFLGFNGAAIFRPRKPHPPQMTQKPQRQASMGPRSFDRGNRNLMSKSIRLWVKLQWGRDLSTAETSIAWK